jgi:hypothetical protein
VPARRHCVTQRASQRDQRQLSVAILLTYGTARVLLAGDAEAREEEYMANGPYTGPMPVINVPKLHTLSEPRFRALLTKGSARRLELMSR